MTKNGSSRAERSHQLRKVTKKRGSFPNHEAVGKVLYFDIMKASERWTRPVQDCSTALGSPSNRLPGMPARMTHWPSTQKS